ncbi:MAG: oxidoreductase [Bacteroidota bacterium]
MGYRCLLLLVVLIIGCATEKKPKKFHSVHIETLFRDSVSIRAIEFLDQRTLAFAGSHGIYGSVDVNSSAVRTNVMQANGIRPEFRAIGHTTNDFFMLSVANPALLYKTGDAGRMELVYKEEADGVFYDSMKFWNNMEGIAIGDSMKGCLSIIITRDGGNTWTKLSCSQLPEADEGEGAFAASNTNIAIYKNNVWVGTSSGNVYSSNDKGNSWVKTVTPIISKEPAQGIYSIDFYSDKIGFAIGGDYTRPELRNANKIYTVDGGRSWHLIADGEEPNYKSCVQFVPNSDGNSMVAVGFTGISFSGDGGYNWDKLSEEGFYSLRFLNDSVAFASGKHRIAKITFN